MPERLQLTQNAQFYSPRLPLTTDAITSIFEAATLNRKPNTELFINHIRVERTMPETSTAYTYSVRVFEAQRPVYFLTEGLFDSVYAYILVIEMDNYVAIFRKSCANIYEATEAHLNNIDLSRLTSTFNDDDVEFQKISLRNMTVSDRALRSRSYEAADLKGLLSTHAAGRSIPYYIRIRQGERLKTYSGNTGRVVESTERKNLDDIAAWVKNQISLFENPATNKSFLSAFAKHVDLDTVKASSSPTAILIDAQIVYDYISKTGTPVTYKTNKGRILNISGARINTIIKALEMVYEINHSLQIVGYEGTSRIKINQKSISISSKPLRRIYIQENGKEISLQAYIVKHSLFSVCFTDPQYMYFMGKCFQDSSGISEINSILRILVPQASFESATSEKGNVYESSIDFEQGSMFSLVEGIHANDDYILCDDLGNEWADHITMNQAESCIAFIHSKYGDTSKSASNLHDLVGQGVKNLGNMYFSVSQMVAKSKDKFSKTYKNNGVNSQINRARKGSISDINTYTEDLLKDYKIHRKCILSCSFLSKSEIAQEFNRITNGESVPGNIVQLLWIISSFAHAAKDNNVIPIIYCKP